MLSIISSPCSSWSICPSPEGTLLMTTDLAPMASVGVAKEEAETFLTRARSDIERERDNAIEEVRQQFADLAITAAERVVERSLDKDAHREVIEKVLQESSKIGESG